MKVDEIHDEQLELSCVHHMDYHIFETALGCPIGTEDPNLLFCLIGLFVCALWDKKIR